MKNENNIVKKNISHVVKESHFWVAQFEKPFALRTDLKLNHKSSLLNCYLISMMERFKQPVFLASPHLPGFFMKRCNFIFLVGTSEHCHPLKSL